MRSVALVYGAGLSVVAALAGPSCVGTRHNPANCDNGTCIDPDLPFCDVDGSVAGQPHTCIAPHCTPGNLQVCRGTEAIQCNETGDNFDVIQCERGCDPTQNGCHICDASQTACVNGKVATCDASGKITTTETCPLGCFEDQPRCREIDPSNGLAKFYDMVPNPPDLDLTDATFNVASGTVTQGTTTVSVPNFLVPAPTDGVAIRVFVANHIRLHGAHITASFFTGDPAIAILARHEVVVDGRLVVDPGVGDVAFPSCMPTRGEFRADECRTLNNTRQDFRTGDGGGSFATAGGAGGGVDGGGGPCGAPGGVGGKASGNATLVPLRGACYGGGAIQLVSRVSIKVDGTIDVRGFNGGTGLHQESGTNGGGGAGGGVILEAPTVELSPSTVLMAKGGAGAAYSELGQSTPDDTDTSTPGWKCTPPNAQCGDGGQGAGDAAAGAGITVPYTNSNAAVLFTGGGGGGGMGRVRINTRDGSYDKSNTTVEAAVLTSGTIRTR